MIQPPQSLEAGYGPDQPTPTVLPRLGVDIGRVIIRDDTDDHDKSIFGANFLQAPAVEGALEALRELTESGQWDQIHLVSKCGPVVQGRTLEWFDANDFFARTGISARNVHFCLERPEKGIIAGQLVLTHFVDDRQDVLRGMPDRVKTRVLFGAPQDQAAAYPDLIVAQNWEEAKRVLSD